MQTQKDKRQRACERARIWRLKHLLQARMSHQRWLKQNPSYNCQWWKAHPEYKKQYWLKHQKVLRTQDKNWRLKHKIRLQKYKSDWRAAYRQKHLLKVRQQETKYQKDRFQRCPEHRIVKALRGRIYKALTKGVKSASTLQLLGCSVDELKNHLQSHFISRMAWKNYGKAGWDVDHIRSCASFADLSDPKQQKVCFHYTNLQPLWHLDNFKKGIS